MKHVDYVCSNVCSKSLSFDLDQEGKIYNLKFVGGCAGNLKAIGQLVEGQSADHIISLFDGNNCGLRPTSCSDQLAKALIQALKENI